MQSNGPGNQTFFSHVFMLLQLAEGYRTHMRKTAPGFRVSLGSLPGRQRETYPLRRRGSRSLTSPGVHREPSSRESLKPRSSRVQVNDCVGGSPPGVFRQRLRSLWGSGYTWSIVDGS